MKPKIQSTRISRKTAAYEALTICRLLYPWRAILTPRSH
jgi:hypothetical protein